MKPNAKVSELTAYDDDESNKTSSAAQTYDDDEADKTSSSAQTVAFIDDLLIQIFLSIPLKPLFRLKLVSKHWNFIISGKHFNLLRKQNPNPAVGLIFKFRISLYLANISTSLVSFDKPTNGPLLRTLKFNSPCVTLSSCNGLLLCQRIFGNDIFDPNQRYCVCNPTTNKYFTLPKLDKPAYCIHSMSLSFDPSKSPHYKVVCVRKMSSKRNQLDVYSSETRSWREHGDPFSADVDFSRGVYWNGAIHWISSIYNAGKSLYFNPDIDQVPQVMPTPPMDAQLIMPCYSSWSCNSSYFGESCGHLHYIEEDKEVTELNVYEMRIDYSEWFLKYRVDCSVIENRLVTRLCALIRGNKKDEDSFLVWGSEKRIIRHNLVYKTCETIYEILDAASARFFPTWEHPLQYIESLSRV